MSFDLSAELDRRGISKSALATAIKVNKSAVTRWTKWGIPIPAERVFEVESFTGISRHKLRPDLFGPIAKPSEAAA